MANSIAVLMTAYNEGDVIDSVIARVPDWCDVWVVDDGSEDDTAAKSRAAGARVLRLPVNLGQGAAAITGYLYLATKRYDFLVKMDGDGQHDPEEIPLFINELKRSNADMVVGSRIIGANYFGAPFARRVMLTPLTKLLNMITGYRLTDSMCGYRAFHIASLKRMAPLFSSIIEPQYMASELILRMADANLKVMEVPIRLHSRKAGFSYKGLFRYGWGVFATIVRTKLHLFRD